jgi:DNA-binding NarL/FixJ family response regulator
MTEEAIAAQLHLSTRTVRRRIAEAMDSHGVTNRFTLGRAWSRARR